MSMLLPVESAVLFGESAYAIFSDALRRSLSCSLGCFFFWRFVAIKPPSPMFSPGEG